MYVLPETLKSEIETFEQEVSDFRAGKTEPVKFKAHRVPLGIYEQRENDSYMVRVRCPGGMISPAQLNGVAQLTQKTGIGPVHLTTRQELQLHNVSLEQTPGLLKELYELGLSSRGGGGNTVRNIMGSEDAGIAFDEAFDVSPYVLALTNTLIAEPDSWSLPRKYKIAFSGSDADNAHAIFNDLGFIATIRNGQRGFKVYLGGGLGSKPTAGHLLFDFLPDSDILYVAEAVKQMFSEHGNRRNRHKARLRHLFYKLGREKVFDLFFSYFNPLKEKGHYPVHLPETSEKPKAGKKAANGNHNPSFRAWKERYVKPQQQTNRYSAEIPIEHGLIHGNTLLKFGQFLEPLGEDMLRLTMRQNIRLRNIPGSSLKALYEFLNDLGIETGQPRLLNNLVACTGADTCRLGVCLAKGASTAIRTSLKNITNEELDHLEEVRINLSGCPNSCGQHSVADLGFYGKASRNDRLYPAYHVMAGGQTGTGKATLGLKLGEVSARDLPAFTTKVLEHYVRNKHLHPNFRDYLKNAGNRRIKELLAEFRDIPSFEEDKNYYFDWGGQELFSLKGKGNGECSAGMFDMIDFDRDSITKLQENLPTQADSPEEGKSLRRIVFHASRMLLVTRGVEPVNNDEVYTAFRSFFIDEGHVGQHFSQILELARNNRPEELIERKNDVMALAERVNELYENMDDSLQFHAPKADKGESITPQQEEKVSEQHFKDLRGVACPMNFVKTKIELAKLSRGELLEILLDDGPPIQNVPGSVRSEGHEVVRTNRPGEHWSVLVRKN
ncbi:MAG: sulfurtransferase TusA family protein [Marinilabilia sp.]